jgi:hypothetical protein
LVRNFVADAENLTRQNQFLYIVKVAEVKASEKLGMVQNIY